ncbi:MAG: tetratricopeptide repeat protein [Planctomycetes bacterium]|nr:tetratricopeptide repeat protein [Planctomycetota bacterium]
MLESEPVAPRLLNAKIDRDLETVTLKCLEKEPRRRYTSAQDFAEDLGRYLQNEPVRARPVGTAERLWRWCRRNPVVASLTAAVAALLVTAVLGLAVSNMLVSREQQQTAKQWKRAEDNRTIAEANEARAKQNEQRAREEQQRAEREEQIARRRQYAAQVNLAHQSLEQGQIARAMALVEGLRPKFDEEDLRGFEWYYLWEQLHRNMQAALIGHREQVTGLQFSSDGTTLFSSSRDQSVRQWDVASKRVLATLVHPDPVEAVAVSHDDQRLAAGLSSGAIHIWERREWEWHERAVFQAHDTALNAMAFLADGTTLATAASEGWLKLWDTELGHELTRMAGDQAIRALALSPDGMTIAGGGSWGTVRLWSRKGDSWSPRTLEGTHEVYDLAFSPDGRRLAAGTHHQVAVVWDTTTGKVVERKGGDQGIVYAVKFAPDGQTLVAGCRDGSVRFWSVTSDSERKEAHLGPVAHVACSPDGQTVAAAGEGAEIRLWRTQPRLAEPAMKYAGPIYSLSFPSQGDKLLVQVGSDQVHVWSASIGQATAQFPVLATSEAPATYSPDGTRIATGDEVGDLRVYDASTGKELVVLRGHKQYMSAVSFSPDGKWLASVDHGDEFLRVWDLETASELKVLPTRLHWTLSLRFSPDGRLLAAGGGNRNIEIWDTTTWKLLRTLPMGSWGPVWSVVFSPDGKTLATSSSGGPVTLWDVTTGAAKSTLQGHTGAVRAIAFSPDGKTLVSTSDDRSVKIWDLELGIERMTLAGHTAQVSSVAFDPADGTLYTGSEDTTVRVWREAKGEMASDRQTELGSQDRDGPMVAFDTARLYEQLGNSDEALRGYGQAATRLTELAAAFPHKPFYRLFLSRVHSRIATLLRARNQFVEALVEYDEMVRLGERLVEEFPHDPVCRQDLARAYFELGRTQEDCGNFQAAAEARRRAAEDYIRLVSDFPSFASVLIEFGPFAVAMANHGQKAEAEQFLNQAAGVAQRSAQVQSKLAWSVMSQLEADLPFASRALELAQKAVDLDPQQGEIRLVHGVALCRAGQWDAALASLELSTERSAVVNGLPWAYLALAHHKRGDHRAAHEWYLRAKPWLEENAPKQNHIARLRAEVESTVDESAGGSTKNRPADSKWWVDAAQRSAQNQQWQNALDRVQRAIDLDATVWRQAAPLRGLLLARLGRWNAAIASFTWAIGQDEKNLAALRGRAEAYLQQERFEQAAADFATAIELDPNDWELCAARARINVRLGRWDQAAADFSRAMELNPDEPALWPERARAYAKSSQGDKAVADFSRAIELQPDNSTLRHERARAYFGNGQWASAAAEFDRAIELGAHLDHAAPKDVENARAWDGLAVQSYRAGDLGPAHEAFERAEQLRPADEPIDWFAFALVQWKQGEQETALETVERGIQWMGENDAWLAQNTAYATLLRQRRQEATTVMGGEIVFLDRAVARKPTDPTAWLARARHYRDANQPAKAIDDYTKALELQPGDASLWTERGNLFGLPLLQWDKAVADFTRAIELDPKKVTHWGGRGHANFVWGRYNAAAADLAKAIDMGSLETADWLVFAEIMLHNGKTDAYRDVARQLLERFGMAREPGPAYLVSRASLLLPDVADPQRLLELAKLADRGEKTEPWFLHNLAWASYRAARYDDAIRYAEQCRVAGRPLWNDASTWLVFALAHHRLGHVEEAQDWLRKSDEWIAAQQAQVAAAPADNPPIRGHHWLEILFLQREARALIGAKP